MFGVLITLLAAYVGRGIVNRAVLSFFLNQLLGKVARSLPKIMRYHHGSCHASPRHANTLDVSRVLV